MFRDGAGADSENGRFRDGNSGEGLGTRVPGGVSVSPRVAIGTRGERLWELFGGP
jgi:hypothetical protein